MEFQPYLFEIDIKKPNGEVIRRSGRIVVEKLLKVRRTFDENQRAHAKPLNRAIEEIRSMNRLSDSQREELIMIAIERQGATTVIEIAEDTRIARPTVEKIIEDLKRREILYEVRKFVVGSGKPNYALKSRRIKLPEAD